ncbi:MAG: hypothetical protein ACREQT_08555, partial [Candidatus Binataceae bacterium]
MSSSARRASAVSSGVQARTVRGLRRRSFRGATGEVGRQPRIGQNPARDPTARDHKQYRDAAGRLRRRQPSATIKSEAVEANLIAGPQIATQACRPD